MNFFFLNHKKHCLRTGFNNERGSLSTRVLCTRIDCMVFLFFIEYNSNSARQRDLLANKTWWILPSQIELVTGNFASVGSYKLHLIVKRDSTGTECINNHLQSLIASLLLLSETLVSSKHNKTYHVLSVQPAPYSFKEQKEIIGSNSQQRRYF